MLPSVVISGMAISTDGTMRRRAKLLISEGFTHTSISLEDEDDGQDIRLKPGWFGCTFQPFAAKEEP